MKFEEITNMLTNALFEINKMHNLFDFPKSLIINIDLAIVLCAIFIIGNYLTVKTFLNNSDIEIEVTEENDNEKEDFNDDVKKYITDSIGKYFLYLPMIHLFRISVIVIILNILIFFLNFTIGPEKQIPLLKDALLNLEYRNKNEKLEWYKSSNCKTFEKDLITTMNKTKNGEILINYFKNKNDFLLSEITNQQTSFLNTEKILEVPKENLKEILQTILSNI